MQPIPQCFPLRPSRSTEGAVFSIPAGMGHPQHFCCSFVFQNSPFLGLINISTYHLIHIQILVVYNPGKSRGGMIGYFFGTVMNFKPWGWAMVNIDIIHIRHFLVWKPGYSRLKHIETSKVPLQLIDPCPWIHLAVGPKTCQWFRKHPRLQLKEVRFAAVGILL